MAKHVARTEWTKEQRLNAEFVLWYLDDIERRASQYMTSNVPQAAIDNCRAWAKQGL